MCKSDMWKRIQEMAKSDPIIAKAMNGYNDGSLEDQAQILMAIVLDQAAVIDFMKLQASRIQSNYYAQQSFPKGTLNNQ